MKVDNDLNNKYLEDLFKQVPLENTSPGFSEKVLLEIEREIVIEKKRNRWITIAAIVVGVLAILSVPAIIFYFWPIENVNFALDIALPSLDIKFNSYALYAGLAVLYLLIVDTLLRRHHFHKTKRSS